MENECYEQEVKPYWKMNYKPIIIIDQDSFYRSPWSNAYEPPLEDGTMPSEKLRQLEIQANSAFELYREM